MRIFTAAVIVVALAILAGCGGSDDGAASPADGGQASAREVRGDFEAEPSCKRPPGASRWGCSVGSLRCQGIVTDRGWSVSCSEPGRSVAFVVRR
ncbi:MAG TPA: hypothetical protein VKB23_03985 [Solirubrobacterales bacterium]|nr:hypothetical protein [Solirubrobacterales bacterium]